MEDLSPGHQGDKQPLHYQQWRPNIWPSQIQLGNYLLISPFKLSASNDLLQSCSQTMRLRNLLQCRNQITKNQSILISDTTSFGTISKRGHLISNISPATNSSQTSLPNHYHESNTKHSSVPCTSIRTPPVHLQIKPTFSVEIQFISQLSNQTDISSRNPIH
jgi:hypothetical protein